jgi:hypothetical protein
MTSSDRDPLVDLLRAGPPEESAYDPPGLPPSELTGMAGQTVHRRGAPSDRTTRTPLAALLGVAAIVALGAVAVMSGGKTVPSPPPGISTVPSVAGKIVTPAPTTGDARWPKVLPVAYGDGPAVIVDDGSIYVGGRGTVLALDPTGRVVDGWPVELPHDDSAIGLIADPAGGVYVHARTLLSRLSPDGQVRDGWPVSTSSEAWDPMSDGQRVAYVEAIGRSSRLHVLTPAGTVPDGWPVELSGDPVGDVAFGPGGRLLATVTRDGVPTLLSFEPDGTASPGWPRASWQHVVVRPSGDIVAWTHLDQTGRIATTAVARTMVTVMGADGEPRTGWPVEIKGAMSAPVFDAPGTLVAVVGAGEAGGDEVVALGIDGRPPAGWPVRLGAAAVSDATTPHEPQVPVPPVVGDDTVYVIETSGQRSALEAFRSDGQRLPGWPYVLPAGESYLGAAGGVPGSAWVVPAPSQAGGVFLATHDQAGVLLHLLDSTASPVPGWPVHAGPDLKLARWLPLSDGGLEVEFTSSIPQATVTRYDRDGSVHAAR